jgi:hypothetical protein
MSKVFEYFNELDELNGNDEPVEPTDTELAEIEADAEHQAMLREFEQEVLDFPELYG